MEKATNARIKIAEEKVAKENQKKLRVRNEQTQQELNKTTIAASSITALQALVQPATLSTLGVTLVPCVPGLMLHENHVDPEDITKQCMARLGRDSGAPDQQTAEIANVANILLAI